MQVVWAWSTIADHAASGVVVAVVGAGIKIITRRMNALATKEFVSAEIEAANNRQIVKINGTYVRSDTHKNFMDEVRSSIEDIRRRLQ